MTVAAFVNLVSAREDGLPYLPFLPVHVKVVPLRAPHLHSCCTTASSEAGKRLQLLLHSTKAELSVSERPGVAAAAEKKTNI